MSKGRDKRRGFGGGVGGGGQAGRGKFRWLRSVGEAPDAGRSGAKHGALDRLLN